MYWFCCTSPSNSQKMQQQYCFFLAFTTFYSHEPFAKYDIFPSGPSVWLRFSFRQLIHRSIITLYLVKIKQRTFMTQVEWTAQMSFFLSHSNVHIQFDGIIFIEIQKLAGISAPVPFHWNVKHRNIHIHRDTMERDRNVSVIPKQVSSYAHSNEIETELVGSNAMTKNTEYSITHMECSVKRVRDL